MVSLKKFTAVAIITLPCYVSAAPTITFEGEVTDQTCSVDINGQTNSVVLLPTVSLSAFGGTLTNGQTAGLASFTVAVSGCAQVASATNISTKFLGYDVHPTHGTLGNRATTNAAQGFGVQLISAAAAGTPVVLAGATSVPGLVLPANATTASHDYGVQYYVTDAASATAGKVTAVAEYTLSYF